MWSSCVIIVVSLKLGFPTQPMEVCCVLGLSSKVTCPLSTTSDVTTHTNAITTLQMTSQSFNSSADDVTKQDTTGKNIYYHYLLILSF